MTDQVVVLASGSPRRRDILGKMGVRFIVDTADVDERCDGTPESVVATLAKRKAAAVASRHPDSIILGADTIVYCDEILGKPADTGEAIRMLQSLSNRWHDVYTGVCVLRDGTVRCQSALTRVHFTALTENEIRRYVDTGDPMDKAGAYAIQGMAGMFIDRIDGCPHNVMGLPMALTKQLLTF